MLEIFLKILGFMTVIPFLVAIYWIGIGGLSVSEVSLRFLPFMPFFFLFIAIQCLVEGVGMTIQSEKTAKEIATKKKKPEPTKKQIFRKRITGVVYIVIATLLIITLKIDVGFLEKPELILPAESQITSGVFKSTVEDFLNSNMIPGMVLGIVDESGSQLFTFGYKGIDRNEKMTGDTIFEIGSIGKVFTGLILAEAVDSGSVSLEDPISSFIDKETKKDQDFFDQITLGNLATHTSGLPRLPPSLSFTVGSIISSIIGGNPYESFTEDKIFSYLNRTASPKSIGTNWEYSNFAFGLLGVLLANQKGLSYEESMQTIITEPLGMTNTTINLSQEQGELFASGYRGYLRLGSFSMGMKSAPWLMGEGMVSAGGIRSTGVDMLKFLEACITEELEIISISKEPLFQVNERIEMGMGWIIDHNSIDDQTVIWHNGQTGGFNSYIAFFADKSAGVFVMANTTVNIQGLGEEILSLTLSGER